MMKLFMSIHNKDVHKIQKDIFLLEFHGVEVIILIDQFQFFICSPFNKII